MIELNKYKSGTGDDNFPYRVLEKFLGKKMNFSIIILIYAACPGAENMT